MPARELKGPNGTRTVVGDGAGDVEIVGDFSVIGAGALLFPGARLGRHVIVAGGSRVTGDVADYQLVRGDPARVMCGAWSQKPMERSSGRIRGWEREPPRDWFVGAEDDEAGDL